MAKDLADHLRANTSQVDAAYLQDLAHTLGTRRSSFPYRAVVVALGADELISALEDKSLVVVKSALKNPVIGFVFTGQGAQWAGMGKELMDAFPVYARTIERCRDHLMSIGASWDVIGT